jgi:type IV secretion system protein VirD4
MSKRTKLLIAAGGFLLLWITGILGWLIERLMLLFFYVGLPILLPVLGIGLPIWFFQSVKSGREKFNKQAREQGLEKIMSSFGESPDERIDNINRRFDEKSGNIDFHFARKSKRVMNPWEMKLWIGRTLASMSGRDREALRASLIMFHEKVNFSTSNTEMQVLGLLWGDGQANIFEGSNTWGLDKNNADALTWYVGADKAAVMVDLVIRELQQAIKEHPDNEVLTNLGARLLGNGADLRPPKLLAPVTIDDMPGEALILGGDAKDPEALYAFKGEGSLITVAPSRSGKSQCHVIPNLLTWNGPAVVLDVKNELFEKTSGWRAANVGPVIKFSPLTPESSHRYNPVAEVSDDPDHIWEDSRFLADMLIVPSGGKDPFWENKARDILTAAIANVVYLNPPNERGLDKVLDIIHGVGWERFLAGLSSSEIPTMKRAAKSLGDMESRLRDNVLQTALASLSAWDGPRMSRATAASDWRPADLRSGKNLTIYICLRPNEVDSYISVLRVMIAQHIRRLVTDLPSGKPPSILFLLDELPRLRHMPPVEEALEIGAQYGIKLWMFVQTVSQLETAYGKNADGMVGGCAVRCFMNPGMQDGLAQDLSDQLGFRDSLLDGTRVKIAEPTVLAGPDFKDRIIVMATGATPGTVEKRQAHQNETFAARMAIPPATFEEKAAANG